MYNENSLSLKPAFTKHIRKVWHFQKLISIGTIRNFCEIYKTVLLFNIQKTGIRSGAVGSGTAVDRRFDFRWGSLKFVIDLILLGAQ